MNDKYKTELNTLIECLIAMKSSSEEKKQIYGYGNVGDEIIIDFEFNYSNLKDELVKEKIINKEQYDSLNIIDNFLNHTTINYGEDFWWDLKNKGWDDLKILAENSLVALGRNNLKIKTNIINHDVKSDDGKILTVQMISNDLIEE